MFLKYISKLFSTRAAGIYILLFAISIGTATFIENDFGTSTAQKLIFRSWWFELLLVLFAGSILVNIRRFKLIKQKKWATLLFHLAILVILLGAGITRYFGSEGRMYIREGEQTNQIVSSNSYLKFKIKTPNGKSYTIDEPVNFASLGNNKFDRSYQIGSQLISISLDRFIPNPGTELLDDDNGKPTIKLVVTGGEGREEYYLQDGDTKLIHNTQFNFTKQFDPNAINIVYQNKSLMIQSPDSLSQFQMAAQKTDLLAPGIFHPLLVRTLYSAPNIKFVVGDFKPKASTQIISTSLKLKNESLVLIDLNVEVNGKKDKLTVQGTSGELGEYKFNSIDQVQIGGTYGSKFVKLPFAIKLNDFILDRYPGTNSPSSYASEVTLIDHSKNITRDQRIYMNHVLDHRGYRFFQSSYDRDELGTVLSVNHDRWGTILSYLGYFLLTLGMMGTLLTRSSRFRHIIDRLKEPNMGSKKIASASFFLILAYNLFALDTNLPAIDPSFAKKFGLLQVQDQNGRLKPMNTQSSEVLRKISRSETYAQFNADQAIVGMMAFPENWADAQIIKIPTHQELKKYLPKNGKFASYNDFFNPNYILENAVTDAYNRDPKDRSTFEKDLIKLDEKINICNLIFSGRIMQWFPIENDKNNKWISPADPHSNESNTNATALASDMYSHFILSVREASSSKNWKQAYNNLQSIHDYQQKFGKDVIVSPTKLKMEIFLNKLNIFSRAGKLYGLLGLILLALFFISIFNPVSNLKWPTLLVQSTVFFVFLLHTLGLGIRWYVSGRAPWSNGYESMIYIAFTTMLSAFLFTRKSIGGLAAACILASTILMVAGLSFMDPEITPLVPVLKSYWLTIHVSMEAGSYGFLVLGALIGMLNLILMICTTANNKDRIARIINELTVTSELILIAGLMIISIGTYLGGVWANESWGRYWGWDAKETWALVTILVYAFILHMRFIPGLRGNFAFNVSTLFGFASVLMTYFGVNYYLSGLHSYAAGDPVPVPTFVYYTVATLITISIMAKWKYKLHYQSLKFSI